MAMRESTSLELLWEAEMEDYAQTSRARNHVRRAREKSVFICATGLVIAGFGWVAGQPPVFGAGVGVFVGFAILLGPGQVLNVRSFWRRAGCALRPRCASPPATA